MKGKAKIIIENQGLLLVLKPIDKDKLTLIGGTVDKKEKPVEAVIREAYEEAGVIINIRHLAFFYSCPFQSKSKEHYFYCFALEDHDVLYELKEKEKFKYVDWVPIHIAVKKLKGIEKNIVLKYLNEKSIKTQNRQLTKKMLAS